MRASVMASNGFLKLSLKRGFGGCGHGISGCDGFSEFSRFDGFGGVDRFYRFGGFEF